MWVASFLEMISFVSFGRSKKIPRMTPFCLLKNDLLSTTSGITTLALRMVDLSSLYQRNYPRSQAICRFLAFECSLRSRNQFKDFNAVGSCQSCFHGNLQMPPQEVFYLPMHAIRKGLSSTTKLRAVFAKSTSGISLIDTLLVEPTIHPPLTDVLLCF